MPPTLKIAPAGTALADPIPTVVTGHILNWASMLAATKGDRTVGEEIGKEALAFWRAIGDRHGEAIALHVLAVVALMNGEWKKSAALFDEELGVWSELGQPRCRAMALLLQSQNLFLQGELDLAKALTEEAYSILQTFDDRRYLGQAASFLGRFAVKEGRLSDAARSYRDSLHALVDSGSWSWLFMPLAGLASSAARNGQLEIAAQFLGSLDEHLLRTGSDRSLVSEEGYEQASSTCRLALGEDRFIALKREGRGLTLSDWIADADAIVSAADERARQSRRRGAAPAFGVTRREIEVLSLLAQGKTDREIATILSISYRTVNTHVASIRSKLSADTRREAVSQALDLGLLPPQPTSSPAMPPASDRL